MKKIILKKIKQQLINGINTEPKVLYLLAEIRKIREMKRESNKDPKTIFDFYCDWALHPYLDHPKTIKEFLGRFEPYIRNDIATKVIAEEFIKNEPEFFKLNIVKNELKSFLNENSLPIELVQNVNYWNKFVIKLLEILKECSLRPKDGPIKELLIIDGKNRNSSFKFHLRDGRSLPIVKLKWKSK